MVILTEVIKKVNKSNKGFSLVEVSLLILVASIILAGYVTWIAPSTQSHAFKYLKTQQKIELISSTIEKFVGTFGRLPCPALNTQPLGTVNSGTNISFSDENLNGTNCTSSVGAVPVNALGLPTDFMLDEWGRKITFAVPSDLCGPTGCTKTTYSNGSATLMTIQDATTGLAFTPPAQAAFVLVGHGPDGRGAYTQAGSQLSYTAGTSEAENSNADNTYRQGTITNTFQHYVFYRNKGDLDNLTIDPNKKLVNLNTCLTNSTYLATINNNTAYNAGAASLRNVLASPNTQIITTNVPDEFGVNQTITYNYLDEAVLDMMWYLQEACYVLYPSDMPATRSCPGGATFDSNLNACICNNGSWNGSC